MVTDDEWQKQHNRKLAEERRAADKRAFDKSEEDKAAKFKREEKEKDKKVYGDSCFSTLLFIAFIGSLLISYITS